jgi:hypothetical protein
MVTGSERLGPLSDYTANCRPVLSSERAPPPHLSITKGTVTFSRGLWDRLVINDQKLPN